MTIGHHLVGTGAEKVIVLHGWFGDHTAFAPTMPFLDGDAFTYAFMDYRGYGLSREMAGDYSMEEIVADAIALADHLGWDKFHALGHSMGGQAVQLLSVRAAGRVKSVIALTSVPASGFPMEGETLDLFQGAIDSDDNREAILNFTTGNRHKPTWGKVMAQKSRETTTLPAYKGYLDAWTNTNFAEEVQGNETPMLAVVGKHDLALTEEVMEQTILQWYPNSTLYVLGNAGHYPMIECPVNFATVMEEFFAKNA